ncbi:MAG: cob(I)yrinic acid a,c-diamide adenosyltransferase [Gemmataceae bacterium]
MVYLSRIYTKSGDDGTTGLGDGTRVSKASPRVAAYGTVDEANSLIGLLATIAPCENELLTIIQNDLFDVGADLCVPPVPVEVPGTRLRVKPSQTHRLEAAIDRLNADLEPLNSFVLPGGTPAAAWAHLARTVCRRAEREVVGLMQGEEMINPEVLMYLNRLSDLLFVLARVYNKERGDVLWKPGMSQDQPAS